MLSPELPAYTNVRKRPLSRSFLAPRVLTVGDKEGFMRLIADFIFLVLFVILLLGWLIAWAAFHVAGGGIHLLIVLAVVFLIIHFLRGRRTV